jgi:hypothetical protein
MLLHGFFTENIQKQCIGQALFFRYQNPFIPIKSSLLRKDWPVKSDIIEKLWLQFVAILPIEIDN